MSHTLKAGGGHETLSDATSVSRWIGGWCRVFFFSGGGLLLCRCTNRMLRQVIERFGCHMTCRLYLTNVLWLYKRRLEPKKIYVIDLSFKLKFHLKNRPVEKKKIKIS